MLAGVELVLPCFTFGVYFRVKVVDKTGCIRLFRHEHTFLPYT